MSNQTTTQNPAEKNAQKYFRKAEQNETLAKQTRKTERQVHAAKTAKLRGLRLAKELADREEAEKLAAEEGTKNADAPSRARAKRAAKVKPAAMVRMTY
jgi:uncharacterized protein (DUF2344 family)